MNIREIEKLIKMYHFQNEHLMFLYVSCVEGTNAYKVNRTRYPQGASIGTIHGSNNTDKYKHFPEFYGEHGTCRMTIPEMKELYDFMKILEDVHK